LRERSGGCRWGEAGGETLRRCAMGCVRLGQHRRPSYK
jgi:hypothetical protein